MKVLFVTTIGRTLRAFLLPFGKHFRQNLGWQVDAMATGVIGCPDCNKAFDKTFEVNWTRNPLNLASLLKAPHQIRAVVDNGGYDIVHVHTPIAAFLTRWALRSARNPGRIRVVYTAHGFHFYRGGGFLKNTLFICLEKLAGRWTDFLVVINREDNAAARKYRIVPEDRILFMPGIGVDTSVYDPSKISQNEISAIRAELGVPADELLILMIAEFNPGKRHRDALHAFATLKNKKARLVFAGEGRLRKSMEALAETLEIRDRTHFLGHRRDIPALIRSSAATLLPSEREGLPRSMMESLCLEVPVIGTDIRGVCDLLQGGCGLMVPVGDVQRLANAMTFILENPVKAFKMGQRGRQKMADYDLNHILKLHEELYAKALKS